MFRSISVERKVRTVAAAAFFSAAAASAVSVAVVQAPGVAGDGGRLPKGVYFYRVEAGDNAGTAKFVISD